MLRKVLIAVFILMLASPQAMACTPPSMSPPHKPFKPREPERPHCNQKIRSDCKARAEDYRRAMDEYEDKLERYADLLRVHAKRMKAYAAQAKGYAACKRARGETLNP
jgi:hypothetical protein